MVTKKNCLFLLSLICISSVILCSERQQTEPTFSLKFTGPTPLENTATTLKEATAQLSQGAQLPGISTPNACRYIGFLAVCAGIISIAVTGQTNKANMGLIGAGTLTIGATELVSSSNASVPAPATPVQVTQSTSTLTNGLK